MMLVEFPQLPPNVFEVREPDPGPVERIDEARQESAGTSGMDLNHIPSVEVAEGFAERVRLAVQDDPMVVLGVHPQREPEFKGHVEASRPAGQVMHRVGAAANERLESGQSVGAVGRDLQNRAWLQAEGCQSRYKGDEQAFVAPVERNVDEDLGDGRCAPGPGRG